MSSSSGGPPARQGMNAILLTVIFLVVAALLFYGIFIALPSNSHFGALLLIGVLSLVFALACYLLEAVSRDPAAQRSLTWAFGAMGFATLYLSIGLAPVYGINLGSWWLLGMILLTIFLGITIALVMWRLRSEEATRHQEVARATWRSETPVSAFSYSAANSPSVPATAPPPSSPGQNPPQGR